MEIGLVLSGGGARGFAHLGVIKGLLEQGFQPKMISGVSAGAVIGAMYANGYSPDEILDILISAKLNRYFRLSISRTGFMKMERLAKLYQTHLPGTFEELQLPVFACTTDLQGGKSEFFHAGPLIRPLMASCSIPVVFEPVQINGRGYVDGGVLNNLPVEPLLGKCNYIIGIHTNPFNVEPPLTSMRSVIERSLLLAIQGNIKERIKQCDLFIEPPTLNQFTTLDNAKARDIFEIGYEFTMQLTGQLTAARERRIVRESA